MPLVGREIDDAGVLGEDRLGEVADVLAVIAVFWDGLSECRCLDRGTELVHLVATVVDVELSSNRGAGRLQHTRQSITDHCPAGMPQVQGSGRVGRDELHVEAASSHLVTTSVSSPGRNDLARNLTLSAGFHRDVEEPRPGYIDLSDTRGVTQLPRQ